MIRRHAYPLMLLMLVLGTLLIAYCMRYDHRFLVIVMGSAGMILVFYAGRLCQRIETQERLDEIRSKLDQLRGAARR